MPKMKTRKAVAKRFKITSSGKVMTAKAWGAHLMKSKSSSRQSRLKGETEITGRIGKNIKKQLGA